MYLQEWVVLHLRWVHTAVAKGGIITMTKTTAIRPKNTESNAMPYLLESWTHRGREFTTTL